MDVRKLKKRLHKNSKPYSLFAIYRSITVLNLGIQPYEITSKYLELVIARLYTSPLW